MLKTTKWRGLPYIVLLGLTCAFSLTLHFSPFSISSFGHDAGIFAYVGMALTKGEILYTGAWDNKGPLLYFLNALGVLINYRYGILIIEMLGLFTTSVFMYKTGLLFSSKPKSLVCTTFCLSLLIDTLEGGNLSEEYALPFTMIAFYFIAKFFKNEFILKKYEMMIVGACIAAVLLLRLNILAFLACAVLGVIIVLVAKKEFKTLAMVAGFALLGFFIFLTPFVIYLVTTDSWKMCLDTVYLGVVGFFTDVSVFSRLANAGDMVLNMKNSGALYMILIYIVAFPICFAKKKSKHSALEVLGVISVLGLLMTLLANIVSGASQHHYFMSFVPILIIPAIWMIDKLESMFPKENWNKKFFPILTSVVFIAFFANICSPIAHIVTGYNCDLVTSEKDVKYIAENTEPTDRIQVLGNALGATVYYRTNRLASSNFFYYANGMFSDSSKTYFADEIFSDMIKNPPKLIMFETENKYYDFIAHLTNGEDWEKLIESDYHEEENDFYYRIYKRNS